MPKTRIITDANGSREVPYTAEEELQRVKDEKVFIAEIPLREMRQIREHRNGLLTETDWRAFPDVTMSDEWKTYRQELRDIPASNTAYENVTWPTKPE